MRKQYAGSAGTIETTSAFASSVGAGETFTTNTGSGYPDGSIGPFVIMVESQFTGAKEKILCSARSGNVFTIQQRGYDGTVAINVTAGDIVKHVIDAASLDEASATAALHEQPQVHVSSTFTVADANALPDTYPDGVSYGFAGVTQGFPANGNLITNRYNLNYTSQTIVSRDTPSESGVWVRGGRDTGWSPWKMLVDSENNFKRASLIEPYPSDPSIMQPVKLVGPLSSSPYTVPAGKVLRVNYIYSPAASSSVVAAGATMFSGVSGTQLASRDGHLSEKHFYLSENFSIYASASDVVIYGFLINSEDFLGQPFYSSLPVTLGANTRFVLTYAFTTGVISIGGSNFAQTINSNIGTYYNALDPKGIIVAEGTQITTTGTGIVCGYTVNV